MDAGRVAAALAVVALVGGLAAWRRLRPPGAFEPRVPVVPRALLPAGAPLTAVYFTSRLCGACRDTPQVVRDAAPELPLVALPVHEQAVLARDLGVTETPTLLLVDEEGRIRYARAGNPEPAELWTYVREAWDSLDAEGRLERVPAAAA